jgi:hypothetical protein
MSNCLDRVRHLLGNCTPVTHGLWKELLYDQTMVHGLQQTVDRARNETESFPELDGISEELRRDLGLAKFLQVERSQEKHLVHQLHALVASAAAACWFQRVNAGGEQGFMRWFTLTAELLDDEKPSPTIVEDWNRTQAMHGVATPAAWFWVSHWLRRPRRPDVEVEFATVRENSGEGDIHRLRLYRLNGDQPRLVRHPASALHVFEDDWLRPLEELVPACRFPVCWEIECAGALPVSERRFRGDSAGGAVARAIWHLSQRKQADPGVLVLARIADWSRWSADPPAWDALTLDRVGGIEAKVEAAKSDGRIDTVIKADGGRLYELRRLNDGWADWVQSPDSPASTNTSTV